MIGVLIQSQVINDLNAKATQIGRADDVALVGGRAARDLAIDHLSELAGSRHRGAGPNFYEDAAKSASDVVTEGGAAMFELLKLGLAQRWFGGTIRAGANPSSSGGGVTKYLAIPARDEAFGHRPKDFDDLVFIPRGPDKAMLVQKFQTQRVYTGATKTGQLKYYQKTTNPLVMFWLVTEVTQEADPSVMPTDDEFETAAAQRMDAYLGQLLAEPRPGNN